MFFFIFFKKYNIVDIKIILFFIGPLQVQFAVKFINECQKEILRCAPPSSHVCDFSSTTLNFNYFLRPIFFFFSCKNLTFCFTFELKWLKFPKIYFPVGFDQEYPRVFQIVLRCDRWEVLLGEVFYWLLGTWGWVILTIQIFFKAKNITFCEYWTLVKIKISMKLKYKWYKSNDCS